MRIPFTDWEVSFLWETYGWASEGKTHKWEFGIRLEWLSPYEKEHRATLTKENLT